MELENSMIIFSQTPALTQHWLSSCFCPPGRARGALWFEIRTKVPRPELDRGSFRLQHTPPRSGIVLPWKSHIDKQGIPEYDNFTTIFQRYKPHGIWGPPQNAIHRPPTATKA